MRNYCSFIELRARDAPTPCWTTAATANCWIRLTVLCRRGWRRGHRPAVR